MREIFGGNGNILQAPPTNFSSACLHDTTLKFLTVLLYFPHSFSAYNLELVPLSPCIYLFTPLFISVWTHGYLFYSLGYNPLLALFIFILLFKLFQLWKLLSGWLLTQAPQPELGFVCF